MQSLPQSQLRQKAHDDLVNNYGRFIRGRGRRLENYFLTFQFRFLPGVSHETLLQMMTQRIERFYYSVITRLYRRTKRKAAQGALPLLICFPDITIEEGKVNQGLHWHGILSFQLVDKDDRRIKQPFGDYFHQNIEIFFGLHENKRRDILRSIDLVETDVTNQAVGYMAKTINKNHFSLADIIILPRAKSEH